MPYSAAHSDVIKQFEMKNKPSGSFCPQNREAFRKLVQYALKKAFNDFNFRTLEKTETETSQGKKETVLDSIYNPWAAERKEMRQKQPRGKKTIEEPSVTAYLMERLGQDFEDRFIAYFAADPLSQEKFDDWHYRTCQMFLDNLDGAGEYEDKKHPDTDTKTYPKIYSNLKYGKAQKIVNMMFKHLYCFNSDEPWEEKWDPYFQHCHVTLDNFTLEWFARDIPPCKRIESWSNLDYDCAPADVDCYMFYQRAFRKYFKSQKDDAQSLYQNITPFQAEFYLWPQIQLRLAAEAFIFELNPGEYKGISAKSQKNKETLTKLPIKELILKVNETIQEYLVK